MKASLWCKCLTVLTALIAGRLSAAVTYEYSNKAINHYFHDASAWSRLEIPTAGNNCQIAALDGNATTWVTNDYAEALASIDFKGGSRSGTKNYELTFITRKGVEGTGEPTTFGLPDLANDSAYVYGTMSLIAYENGNYSVVDILNGNTRKGPFAFTGVNLQVGNSNGMCIAKFNEGVFNFGDPNGSANGATLRFGASVSGLAHPQISRFRPGTTLRYDKAQVAANTADSYAANLVDFDGMTATGLTSFTMNQGICNVFGGTTFDVPALSVNNGTFNVFDDGTAVSAPTSLAFSNNGTAVVSNGAHVTVGKLNFNGTSKLTVTGQDTAFTVEGKTTGSSTVGGELAVADGATFTSVEDLALASTRLTVTGGAKVVQEPRGNMSVAAPTNLVSGAGTFVYAVSNLTVGTGSALIIEQGAAVSARMLVTSGSDSRFIVGEGSALTNRAAISFGGGSLTAKPQAVIVNGGVFNSLGEITLNNNSLLEVNGGEAYFQKASGNNLMLGWSSVTNAIVRINGGYAETYRIRIGRNPTDASYSRIEVNGGRFNVPGHINFHQNNAAGKGRHEIVLNGGVLETGPINAGDTAKIDLTDADVTAYLTGDGGTLRALGNCQTAAAPFIEAMHNTWCGDRGLTLDTQSFTVYFNHSLENKPGEEGFFRKVGTGTLILAPNASAPAATDVSTIDVAKGTLNVGGNLSLAETSLVVTNGATLSLVGDATSLTVAGLAVTNGTIMLDPGDVITVNGSLSLNNSRLTYSSTPTLEEAQTFLVAKGELSEETKEELLRYAYGLSLGDGFHGEFEAAYDEQTGMTTVKFKKVATVPITEAATWTATADGAWAAADNWQGGAKPTEKKVAVFNASAEGKATTATGDKAGALRFESGTHVIDGEGLLIAGAPGAANIEVAAGTQTVSAPMTLLGPMPVTIADGATLTIGAVVDGSLEKRDTGHLVLDGALALKGKFVSQDGLVTATNAAAMAATTVDSLEFQTGTFESAERNGEPMRVNAQVDISGLVAKTAVVFKTDTDVTFANFNWCAGNVIKYGPGKMTIEVPANTTRTIAGGTGSIGYSGAPGLAENGFLYHENGAAPEGWMATLTMLEGELVLKGLGDGARAFIPSYAAIGGPCRSPVRVQPTLTVDGVYAQFGNLQNGYELMDNPAYQCKHPCIRVLNGGTLYMNANQPAGYACTKAGTDITYAITNATLQNASIAAYISRSTNPNSPLVRYFANNSQIIANESMTQAGSVSVDLDNGSYFGCANGWPLVFKSLDPTRIYGEILTRNGSTLAMSSYEESASQNNRLTFAFDDGEWVWSKTGATATWPASVKGFTVFEMRGRGVILKPAAGATFTTRTSFTGAGGVVVDGPGTVAFGAAGTYAFSGVCDVKQGTADLTDAGTIAVATFAGTGTVKGAKVTRAKVASALDDDWTTDELPVFSDCTFGTLVIDAGRTAENPLPADFPQNVAVAKWTGAGALPTFKLRNTGLRNVGADFTVDLDGTVRMTPHEVGVILIVR